MKEYHKALKVLTEQEAFDLQQWLSTNGSHPGLPEAFREDQRRQYQSGQLLPKASGTGGYVSG